MNTTPRQRTILVTGATGKQGGAVARNLLKDGWTVRALVRDPEKDAARVLADKGVDLAKGDLFDAASVEAAHEGVHGVYSVQNFWLPDVGFEGEIKQGTILADAAKRAGVSHFVYSSVGAAHRGAGQRHFDSKLVIEQHIQSIKLPYTIVRPAAFMENLEWTREQITEGVFQGWGLTSGKRLQLIAVEDIGVIVAIAFADPDEHIGKTIEISGDELTEEEAASVISDVLRRKVVVTSAPEAKTEEEKAWNRFVNGEGYTADLSSLRKLHPGLRTLQVYLREAGWALRS